MTKKTTVTTTRVDKAESEPPVVQKTTTTHVTPGAEPRVVQQTTTTRVQPEPQPRVVEQTRTVEEKGLLGDKKTTVRRDTVIEE